MGRQGRRQKMELEVLVWRGSLYDEAISSQEVQTLVEELSYPWLGRSHYDPNPSGIQQQTPGRALTSSQRCRKVG